MELYHGTISSCANNIIENNILLKKGKPNVDFGQGFYTTSSYRFAKGTAINKANKTNRYNNVDFVQPVVLVFNLNQKLLNDMNVLRFKENNLKWAQFIINNRNGYDYMDKVKSHFHNKNAKFDIVMGSIADNEITLLTNMLKKLNKKVSVSDINSMMYAYLTNQISFHTEKSLTCIKLARYDIINTIQKKGDVVNE